MSERLFIPEKCNDCPIAPQLRDEFRAAHLNVETEINLHENITQLIENVPLDPPLTEDEKAQGRENILKGVGEKIDEAEDRQMQIQSKADFMTKDCEGTETLKGKNRLGKDVTARICGSPVWHGHTSENAHIQRP